MNIMNLDYRYSQKAYNTQVRNTKYVNQLIRLYGGIIKGVELKHSKTSPVSIITAEMNGGIKEFTVTARGIQIK